MVRKSVRRVYRFTLMSQVPLSHFENLSICFGKFQVRTGKPKVSKIVYQDDKASPAKPELGTAQPQLVSIHFSFLMTQPCLPSTPVNPTMKHDSKAQLGKV